MGLRVGTETCGSQDGSRILWISVWEYTFLDLRMGTETFLASGQEQKRVDLRMGAETFLASDWEQKLFCHRMGAESCESHQEHMGQSIWEQELCRSFVFIKSEKILHILKFTCLFSDFLSTKNPNVPVVTLKIGKFQHDTVLDIKAKFEGNNSHFLYLYGINN